jgi:hemerythrin
MRFAKRIAVHFRHEERLMRASRYSALSWHEQQHRTAATRLRALLHAIRTSSADFINTPWIRWPAACWIT